VHFYTFLMTSKDLIYNVTQQDPKTAVSVLNRKRAYTKEVSCVYKPMLLGQ